jgi:hypothetical protein
MYLVLVGSGLVLAWQPAPLLVSWLGCWDGDPPATPYGGELCHSMWQQQPVAAHLLIQGRCRFFGLLSRFSISLGSLLPAASCLPPSSVVLIMCWSRLGEAVRRAVEVLGPAFEPDLGGGTLSC